MKIGIVGLGLIGGSIFKCLRTLDKYEVIGVSGSVSEHNVTSDYNGLKTCDVVFVCTPMDITVEILDKLNNILPKNTIVSDVCSLKTFLTKKEYNYKFIPSHPMAGTEHSGWDSSFAELFKGAKWVITPVNGYLYDEQEVLENIIQDLGANPVITTPEEHDKAVALISNLPLLVAQALCLNIRDNKLAQVLAASGFRDTTRLALSNVQMANDMLQINRENINKSIEMLKISIDKISESDYLTLAKSIKDFRENLY